MPQKAAEGWQLRPLICATRRSGLACSIGAHRGKWHFSVSCTILAPAYWPPGREITPTGGFPLHEPFSLLLSVYDGDRPDYLRRAVRSALDDQTVRPG